MLVRNRTNYHCLFHFLVRFRTDLSQLLERFQTDYRYYSSKTYYFVYRLSLVQTYTQSFRITLLVRFRTNQLWLNLRHLPHVLVRFRTNYGVVIFPLAGTTPYRLSMVYSIDGIFYLLVRFRTSYHWIWAAGRSSFRFSRSLYFGQSSSHLYFCDPPTRWSSCHFLFAIH